MAEVRERQALGEIAPEVPVGKLKPATYKDLPDVPPLRRVIGPGVISVGIGMASGEFII